MVAPRLWVRSTVEQCLAANGCNSASTSTFHVVRWTLSAKIRQDSEDFVKKMFGRLMAMGLVAVSSGVLRDSVTIAEISNRLALHPQTHKGHQERASRRGGQAKPQG